jgi:hypothetical protein
MEALWISGLLILYHVSHGPPSNLSHSAQWPGLLSHLIPRLEKVEF